MKSGVRTRILVFLGGLFLDSTFATASDGRGIQASGLRVASAPIAAVPVSPLIGVGIATAVDTPPAITPTNVTPPELDKTSGAASGLPTAEEFAQIGEAAFKGRDYKGALRAWRHSLVDDPENGVLMLMLSQALFATEKFSESAGAIQVAMQILPQEKWDVVVKNFRDLYGKGDDYTAQIRALERAARRKPDDAGMRFLLGYHYGFLGYPIEAVKQLQKCLSVAPQDEVAKKLLRIFEERLPKTSGNPSTTEPPASSKRKVPDPSDFVPPKPPNPGVTTTDPTTEDMPVLPEPK